MFNIYLKADSQRQSYHGIAAIDNTEGQSISNSNSKKIRMFIITCILIVMFVAASLRRSNISTNKYDRRDDYKNSHITYEAEYNNQFKTNEKDSIGLKEKQNRSPMQSYIKENMNDEVIKEIGVYDNSQFMKDLQNIQNNAAIRREQEAREYTNKTNKILDDLKKQGDIHATNLKITLEEAEQNRIENKNRDTEQRQAKAQAAEQEMIERRQKVQQDEEQQRKVRQQEYERLKQERSEIQQKLTEQKNKRLEEQLHHENERKRLYEERLAQNAQTRDHINRLEEEIHQANERKRLHEEESAKYTEAHYKIFHANLKEKINKMLEQLYRDQAEQDRLNQAKNECKDTVNNQRDADIVRRQAIYIKVEKMPASVEEQVKLLYKNKYSGDCTEAQLIEYERQFAQRIADFEAEHFDEEIKKDARLMAHIHNDC